MFVRLFALALYASLYTQNAIAETNTVELGWTKIVPCSKFDLKTLTAKFADQRLYGYANFDLDNANKEITDQSKQCVLSSFNDCGGVTSLLAPTTLAGCMAEKIVTCLAKNAVPIALSNVHVWTRTECRW
jgi:hypothetical protein